MEQVMVEKKKDLKRPRADYFRVQITMPKEMDDWLSELGSLCKASGGYKLSKCEIVRACLLAVRDIDADLDVNKVKSEEEFAKRIVGAFTRNRML